MVPNNIINDLFGYAIIVDQYMDTRQLDYINKKFKDSVLFKVLVFLNSRISRRKAKRSSLRSSFKLVRIYEDKIEHMWNYKSQTNTKKRIMDIIKGDISECICWEKIHEASSVISQMSAYRQNKIKKVLIYYLCMDGVYSNQDALFINSLFPNTYEDRKYIEKCLKRVKKKIRTSNTAKLLQLTSAEKIKFEKILLSFEEVISDCEKYIQSDDELLYEIKEDIQIFRLAIERIDAYCPTVAFVGRTKAGKSSLLFAISGKGREFIGQGRQRASKHVVGTYFEDIRFIDTPGLDAASNKGRIDELKSKIAMEYADYIVVVIGDRSDSATTTMRKYINELYRNKTPFMIVTNKKIEKAEDISELKQHTNDFNEIKNDYRNLKQMTKILNDKTIEKSNVWIGAVNYFRFFRCFKNLKENLKLFFYRKQLKDISGIFQLKDDIYSRLQTNFHEYRIQLFNRKKCILKDKYNTFLCNKIQELNQLKDSLTLFNDELLAYVDKCQKEIEYSVKRQFDREFFNKYTDLDLTMSINNLSETEYISRIKCYIDDIMTDSFKNNLNSIIGDYFKVLLDDNYNNFTFDISKKKMSILYGKDIEKILSYSSGILGVGATFLPPLRIPALATGGISFLMSFFTKKSRKNILEINLREQVKEVKIIIGNYRDECVLSQIDSQLKKIRLNIINNYNEKIKENEILREKFNSQLKILEEIFE